MGFSEKAWHSLQLVTVGVICVDFVKFNLGCTSHDGAENLTGRNNCHVVKLTGIKGKFR